MSTTQMVDIEFEELAPGIFVYKNVIDKFENIIPSINEIASTSNEISWQAAGSYNNGKSEIQLDHRDTDQIYVPFYNENSLNNLPSMADLVRLSLRLTESFKKYENDYKGRFFAVTKGHEGYAILRYGVNQKFNTHVDDHPDFTRRVSTVYYLNEDYEGGEIYFSKFNVRYKPKANELLIFPSNYVYSHAVLPITSGVRYAIVSWLN